MTEDYKNEVLDYITGNLTIEEQKQNSFRDLDITTNNLKEKLMLYGIDPNICVLLTTETTSNYIVYGHYTDNGSYYGYIAVLDQDSNVLSVMTTFDSGTPLNQFQVLNYDENGNIYGIDVVNNRYRIILLNNVAINTNNGYVCKLRASYYINYNNLIPPFTYLSGTCFIKKVPNEATYFIFAQTQTNSLLIKFTINVGSENEWNYYLGSNISSAWIYASDFILETSNDTTVAHIYYYLSTAPRTLTYEYFNGETLTKNGSYEFDNPILDLRILNSTSVYVTGRVNNETSYDLFLYELKNGFISIITQINVPSIAIPSFYLNLQNGILFTQITGYTNNSKYLAICGAYNGTLFIQSPTYEMDITEFLNANCIIQKIFSLYKFVIQGTSTVYHPSIVIYDNQYSGEEYTDYNSLVSLHGELYSNEHISFARTLYNKQSYQNITTSTLNVPNNYLNNMPIETQNLLSATMKTLVSNSSEITKNMYENLFINFTNKMLVMDEDTNTMYSDTANYINVNINTGTDIVYNNTSVSKVRINYTTPRVFNINWVWNTDHYETAFTIYTSEIPTSIEFISEDEQTVYITKYFDFALNKYYTISQKLRIE